MKIVRLLGSAILITLCGCLPKERIWWSPNGDLAAVIIDHGLHLADSSGEIIANLKNETSDPGSITIEQVTWLTDGSGIIVNQIRALSKWEEARLMLAKDEVERIESLARNMVSLLTAQITLQPKANSIQAILSGMLPDEEEIASNALLLAYQQEPEAIRQVLKQALPGLKNFEDQLPGNAYAIHELALFTISNKGIVQESKILVRDARLLGGSKISPHFPVIAFARRDGRGLSVTIETYSLENHKRREIANRAFTAFDWSADGRSLIYMTPLSGSDSAIKRIRRIELLTNAGEPLVTSKSLRTRDLATAVIPFLPRVEVLSDGRVLFAAQAGAWPTQGANLELAPRLYLLPEEGGAIKAVPTAEGDLPMNLGHFISSPDGRRVAVVESDTDALVVVELDTGDMKLISEPHPYWKCRTLPSWRNSTELTFAALTATGQIHWMLHNTKGDLKILSTSWPDDATASWMEHKPPTK